MHKGAPSENFRLAEILRQKMTVPESLLWERIKDNQLGKKFRRQHPIHFFIADFYCHHSKLIIEIDGDYHNNEEQKQQDSERSEILKFQDLEIIRFTNLEILNDLEAVIDIIKRKLISSANE
ncbi:endonuclease domain-containing protein [Antarcticibacterium flavum]|uniref:Endonuclease domain-containing protein n=2 Tax=Flavobacteriaceae TaxID=49546 RepID=A0A5B7X9C0_9FLAO|nr:hypothetical protein [Antarcticibacterium sp. W02-3]QCY71392.1 endonuclease domain-containing protein [Antarcticibacterium flavum]